VPEEKRYSKNKIAENVHTRRVDDVVEDELADATQYGEIVPSLFGWTSSEEQEERVDYLNEVSKEITPSKMKDKHYTQ